MNIDVSTIPVWVLVLIAVLAVAQITLDVVALVDLFRRPAERVTSGRKWVWVLVILLVNTLGAILYLAIGRTPAIVAEKAPPTTPVIAIDDVADALYGPRKDTDQQ